MARTVKKTKAEIVAEQVAETVNAGKEQHLESVDFNDPNRPKTCLEVDFPILPINQIAQIEGNAGKPIYQMSKWWARRRSSVFRSTLLAAATKAPDDPAEAAKTIWESYYGNHQKNEAFKKLKVADIFMGGGTTLVEGSRLGMQMTGNDLNPVAWLVVKNELADVDLEEVNKLFDYIEDEVKSQIMPFYACEGPGGEKGIWARKSTGEKMGDDFDPLTLSPEERKDFDYDGPEVIYTFWAKHGPCAAPGCGHRTPVMKSPIIAIKTLSVKTWQGIACRHCQEVFDIETDDVRMAPDSPFVIADTESPYAIIDKAGNYECPHCHQLYQDESAGIKGDSIQLPKKNKKNKKIELTLLVHPNWLKGEKSEDTVGKLGGTATSDVDATVRWNEKRAAALQLIEVRGKLPSYITCPETKTTIDTQKGTVPKNSTFTCQEETCGREQDLLSSIKKTNETGPVTPYAIQCYSPRRHEMGFSYNGRYFKKYDQKDVKRLNAATLEWEKRKNADLKKFWPTSELPYGFMTHHLQGGVPNHGFTHWYKFFNPRQLLVLSQILKAIDESHGFDQITKDVALGAFQQYLRNQCMMAFWHIKADKLASFMSNNNYHSKNNVVESSVFPRLGLGNWESCVRSIIKALEWKNNPNELVTKDYIDGINPDLGQSFSGKSYKVDTLDPLLANNTIICNSSTDLGEVEENSIDMVVTDPPFGGLLHYAELADFFYVWLRLALKDKYPEYYAGEYTPKTLEAVSNKARHPDDPDAFYKRLLTECWREAKRILKPGGILSFTFHHSEDGPWVDVLESLFDAGFYLEATYPIRSDETKGKGEFGSKTIEYDIIHVCRKRTEDPVKISWPRLRREILADVRQLQSILEHHQDAGLPKADIQVIKRGKALEYFSRHYGQVYIEEGREFTVKEALVGINQLLDDQSEGEAGGTPTNCEPITRQFLRIFRGSSEVKRDQIQKYLRGTGIGPSDFIARGWTAEKKKFFHWLSPLEFAKERADKLKSLTRDMDQAMILVGACYENSGIEVKKLLNSEFKPHPALGDLLQWLCSHGADKAMRQNAMTARQLYSTWSANNQETVKAQLALFDMEDEA